MAKVVPGPVAQQVSGALGGLVYYRILGKTVARARVYPHQEQTEARAAWRANFRKIMKFWNFVKYPWRECWERWCGPNMYPYSLFLKDSSSGGDVLPHVWPRYLDGQFPEPNVCREIGNQRWKVTWDAADYPSVNWLLYHRIGTPWLKLGGWGSSRPATEVMYIPYTPNTDNYLVLGISMEEFVVLPEDARQWIGRLWSDTPEC